MNLSQLPEPERSRVEANAEALSWALQPGRGRHEATRRKKIRGALLDAYLAGRRAAGTMPR